MSQVTNCVTAYSFFNIMGCALVPAVLAATGSVSGKGHFSTPTESTPLDRSFMGYSATVWCCIHKGRSYAAYGYQCCDNLFISILKVVDGVADVDLQLVFNCLLQSNSSTSLQTGWSEPLICQICNYGSNSVDGPQTLYFGLSEWLCMYPYLCVLAEAFSD